MLFRTFLSKGSLETLYSSMTFNFPMSVRISNPLFIVGLFDCFRGWGRLIRFCEGFQFAFPGFCHWWDVKLPGEFSFIFQGFCFHLRLTDLKLTPSSLFYFLFFYLPIEWQEVTKRFPAVRLGVEGDSRETPTVSSLVVVMYAEELRLYNQAPTEISLEMSVDPAASTIGEADNAIYFIGEQFTARLRFPFPS